MMEADAATAIGARTAREAHDTMSGAMTTPSTVREPRDDGTSMTASLPWYDGGGSMGRGQGDQRQDVVWMS